MFRGMTTPSKTTAARFHVWLRACLFWHGGAAPLLVLVGIMQAVSGAMCAGMSETTSACTVIVQCTYCIVTKQTSLSQSRKPTYLGKMTFLGPFAHGEIASQHHSQDTEAICCRQKKIHWRSHHFLTCGWALTPKMFSYDLVSQAKEKRQHIVLPVLESSRLQRNWCPGTLPNSQC